MKKITLILFGVALLTFSSCKNEPSEYDCIDSSKINKDRPCNFDYSPVCGCNGQTFNNECEAKRDGVIRYTKGPCKDPCRDQYDNSGSCRDTVPTSELCQAAFQRWFYNPNHNNCELISYSGCSQKGFASKEDCEKCKVQNRKCKEENR